MLTGFSTMNDEEPTRESTLLSSIEFTLKHLHTSLDDNRTLDDLEGWISEAESDITDLLKDLKTLRLSLK